METALTALPLKFGMLSLMLVVAQKRLNLNMKMVLVVDVLRAKSISLTVFATNVLNKILIVVNPPWLCMIALNKNLSSMELNVINAL